MSPFAAFLVNVPIPLIDQVKPVSNTHVTEVQNLNLENYLLKASVSTSWHNNGNMHILVIKGVSKLMAPLGLRHPAREGAIQFVTP